MRKTKIVATVGPSCNTVKSLRHLIHNGVDVFRINASHTTIPKLKYWIKLIRKTSQKTGRTVAIMVDLQGPRVRTGSTREKMPIILRRGELVDIVPSNAPGSGNTITTRCRQINRMLRRGDPVLLDNGHMELKVLKVTKKKIECKVVTGGLLGENKGINLPHAPVTLSGFTDKDKQDLKAAAQVGVDYVALSFVRSENDVMQVKNFLKRLGKNIPVIAKIEKPHAVKRIETITDIADAIMVARGDLGIEMGVAKIPVVQKEIIQCANRKGKPVVTATQMLESMMENIRPTRAEASDIANAVFDGSDAVMLSGETAVGKHPLQAVRMMSSIVKEAEKHQLNGPELSLPEVELPEPDAAIYSVAYASLYAAEALEAKALLVFTISGKTAMLISKLRPSAPIIALAGSEAMCRKLILSRGVIPLVVKKRKNTDALIREGDKVILRSKLLQRNNPVVIVTGKHALPAARYMTKVHRVGT